jgi:hypothetical protein
VDSSGYVVVCFSVIVRGGLVTRAREALLRARIGFLFSFFFALQPPPPTILAPTTRSLAA